MTKHTPGPWATENINDEALVDVVLGYKVPNEGHPILIGSFFHDEGDDRGTLPLLITRKQAAANAKLAAAAPDLLNAMPTIGHPGGRLIKVVAHYEDGSTQTIDGDVVTSAIAKAEQSESIHAD